MCCFYAWLSLIVWFHFGANATFPLGRVRTYFFILFEGYIVEVKGLQFNFIFEKL